MQSKKRSRNKQAKGVASGRVVLTGEHSVVYGEPALVAPVDMKMEVVVSSGRLSGLMKRNKYLVMYLDYYAKELGKDLGRVKLFVRSEIPQRSGLSSSTALLTALYRALNKWFLVQMSDEELFELVLGAERQVYAVSGMDQAAVVFGRPTHKASERRGGAFRFQKIDGKLKWEEVLVKKPVELLLVDSGKPVEGTAEMVSLVGNKSQATRNKTIKKMGKVSGEIIESVKVGRVDLGLVRENERLLEEIGVVGEKAKKLVREVEKLGGAAKISGAGGVKKGSGILVCLGDLEKLEDWANKRSLRNWKVKVGA